MSDDIQYITNSDGARLAVIVPIKEFESMLAEIGLTIDDHEKEPARALRVVLDELRAAGRIQI